MPPTAITKTVPASNKAKKKTDPVIKTVPVFFDGGVVYGRPKRGQAVAMCKKIAPPNTFYDVESVQNAIRSICAVSNAKRHTALEVLNDSRRLIRNALLNNGTCAITGKSIKQSETRLYYIKRIFEDERAREAVALAILGELAQEVKLIFNKRGVLTCGKRPTLSVFVPRPELKELLPVA